MGFIVTGNFFSRRRGTLSAAAASVTVYMLAICPALAEADHGASAEAHKTGHHGTEELLRLGVEYARGF